MSIGTRIQSFLFILLFLAIHINVSADPFEDTVVMGDSLSDQGNLFNITQTAIGFGIPWAAHYYNGRFSDGEIYVGVIADQIGETSVPSKQGGNNFANGGARTDYHTLELDNSKPCPFYLLNQQGPFDASNNFDWTLNEQWEALLDRVHSEEFHDPNALFVVFAGSNDIVDVLQIVGAVSNGVGVDEFLACDYDPTNDIPANIEAFIAKRFSIILNGIQNAIQASVAAGAEHILVPNLPNLGVVPGIVQAGSDAAAAATGLAAAYNEALSGMLAGLDPALEDVNIIPFDFFAFTTGVIGDPLAYGFADATTPCYDGFVVPELPDLYSECSDPDLYVFWDYEHPTTAFHTLMGERMLVAVMVDILDDLLARVESLDVNNGTKNYLRAKLVSSRNELADQNPSNDDLVFGMLEDFVQRVESEQSTGRIQMGKGNALIDGTDKVLSLLD